MKLAAKVKSSTCDLSTNLKILQIIDVCRMHILTKGILSSALLKFFPVPNLEFGANEYNIYQTSTHIARRFYLYFTDFLLKIGIAINEQFYVFFLKTQ